MKQTLLITLSILIFALVVHATTNQFLVDLNAQWTSQNASNVLSYLDTELSSRPDDPQVLFARGVAAAELQLWARGATNYVWQAIAALSSATNYTSEEKAQLLAALTNHLDYFTASIDVLNEPTNSVPQTNTTIQMEMFITHPDEYPYFDFLSTFKEP
ncbi:MAG: hypothetical protein M9910_11615 [Kiritimatiellae bacterium]|nr:hypothetical protein [Kiritimatiellia bacterium]